jgi:hypothetical protein
MGVMKYEDIKPYIQKKLISEQSHPKYPDVKIFNYTQECQYSGAWDDITRQCRGLIMNTFLDTIMARPFPKFFNYAEHVSKGWPIPEEVPRIFDKLDGSLGIMYRIDGEIAIATRGSFTSEQALWATQWFNENLAGKVRFDINKTYLFEIIYPENRIVVNYDYSGLVLLAAIDNQTGLTTHPTIINRSDYKKALPEDLEKFGLRIVHEYPAQALEELEKLDEPNSEGFVIFYPKSDVRMKIKFPEYVRLHKLITGVSEIAIWEHLRDGKTFKNLLEKVPDEFFQWVIKTSNQLNEEYAYIEDGAKRDYEEIIESLDPVEDIQNQRKEFALLALQKKNNGILFSMFSDKPYAQIIWNMVRPRGASSFVRDIDQ